jgi:hypothetical protein
MIEPNEIQAWLDRRPFEPFELQLSTGERYPVKHPENLIVAKRHCYLAVERHPRARIAVRTALIGNVHIVKLEPVNGAGPRRRRRKTGG